MREIISNTSPQTVVEIKNFTPHKNKYYTASFVGTGGETKGIIVSEEYINDFSKPTTYIVLAMKDTCRRNAYYDYFKAKHTLNEYMRLLLNSGAEIFEFDSFKEMTDWLNEK